MSKNMITIKKAQTGGTLPKGVVNSSRLVGNLRGISGTSKVTMSRVKKSSRRVS